MSRTTTDAPAFGPGEPGRGTAPAALAAAYHLAYLEQEALQLGVPAETVKAIVDAGVRAIAKIVNEGSR